MKGAELAAIAEMSVTPIRKLIGAPRRTKKSVPFHQASRKPICLAHPDEKYGGLTKEGVTFPFNAAT